MSSQRYDLAVVGAGLVGLAHALAAARRGLKTIVLERDRAPAGRSLRDAGIVCPAGQTAGTSWLRARRSATLWMELGRLADFEVMPLGLLALAQSPEAATVLQDFAVSRMGMGSLPLDRAELEQRLPAVADGVICGLSAPEGCRFEPRRALPRLADFLGRTGVEIACGIAATGIVTGRIETTSGLIRADRIVVAPGTDLQTLYPRIFEGHGVRLAGRHYLRLAPQPPSFRPGAVVIGDAGILAQGGFAGQRTATALRARPAAGPAVELVQAADGSLVVTAPAATLDPFMTAAAEAAMLAAAAGLVAIPDPAVIERWQALTPVADGRDVIIVAPEPGIRLVSVTGDNAAGTALALAEEVVEDLLTGV